MRNEGGGFAANIYEAMPEDGMQVTSHESLEAIHPYFQTSHLLRTPYIQNSVPLFLISNSSEFFIPNQGTPRPKGYP